MVKIQKKTNGQIVVTIDKSLANGLNLDGGEIAEWNIESRNALKLTVTDRNPDPEEDTSDHE